MLVLYRALYLLAVVPCLVLADFLNVEQINSVWNDREGWEFEEQMLWTQDGPYFKDARQNRVYDCWLPATLASVSWVSPDWISHLLYWSDGSVMSGHWFPSTTDAIIQIWNPTTGKPTNISVDIWNESPTEDRPGKAWWPSAVTQGFRRMGGMASVQGIYGNGTIIHNGGGPCVAVRMLTGKDVSCPYGRDMVLDDWFNILSVGWRTPVVLATLADADVKTTHPAQVKGEHAYGVMFTTVYPNGTRTATLRNPWGYTEEMDAEGLFASTYYIVYLDGLPELHWEAK